MNTGSSCPICRATSGRSIEYRHDDKMEAWRAEIGEHEPYGWFFCPECTSLYPSHQPDLRVLRKVWESARVSQELENESALRKRRKEVSLLGAKRAFNFFSTLPTSSSKRFLDIGCGFGETVKKFADEGWDAEGIDPDPVTETYHQQLGIRTRIGLLEEVDLRDDYDVIYISHAIYFITDPMDFLRSVRKRLKPGGAFCIVAANFLANEDAGLPSYMHTFVPNGGSMRYALALAGFETVRLKHQHGSIYIAARPAEGISMPAVYPSLVWALWRTKQLRYKLIGKPHLALRQLAKAVLTRLGLRK